MAMVFGPDVTLITEATPRCPLCGTQVKVRLSGFLDCHFIDGPRPRHWCEGDTWRTEGHEGGVWKFREAS